MSVLKPATEFNSFIVEERPGEQVITIRGVYLSFNQLSGVIPKEIGKNCGKLEHLDLFGNSLVQGIPSSLGNCGLLRTLLLHFNLLEEVIPIEFGNLKSLEVLAVLRNMLSSNVGELGNCKELSIVVLSNLFYPIGDVEFDSLNDEFSELDEMNGEKMENSGRKTARFRLLLGVTLYYRSYGVTLGLGYCYQFWWGMNYNTPTAL